MAQKLRDDKIGTLQHNAGNIQMVASSSNPAYLTIGGQQYKVTSNLVVALPAMTANTRYQVFAVLNAGVVELRVSQNENSVGPAGFNRWKLVGSLYSNGMSPVAFGSFINISGKPVSINPIPYLPARTSTGTQPSIGDGSLLGIYNIDGDMLDVQVAIQMGSTTTFGSGNYHIGGPSNILVDTLKVISSDGEQNLLGGYWSTDAGNLNYQQGSISLYPSDNPVRWAMNAPGATVATTLPVTSTNPFSFGASDKISTRARYPAVNFSNIPIEDR